ncbi:MAG: insulinase family protein [Bacteroidetes bacterium]|nr:insulinase family protein [Bacteroidota bacterium]
MYLNKKLIVASFLFLVVAVNTTQAQQAKSDVIPMDKNVKVGKLPNGLTYYIRKNVKPEGRVELRLAVNAGSVLEKDNQQGVAHFLEHMAFNGSKNFPKNELTNYLQKAGVRFGADLNAHTGFDETVYELPISSKDPVVLQNGYQVIRDWAGNLSLDSKEIDQERGIILEEKRMRLGAGMRMVAQYFPKMLNNAIYGKRLPIGTEEVIKTAPRKAFSDFYNDWYRPNNMAVIVVGDIDVAQAEATIKKMFSDLKNPAKSPARPARMPIEWHKADKAFVVTDKEQTNNTVQIYLGSSIGNPASTWKSYNEDAMNRLVSDMIGNRLQENMLKASSPIGFGGVSFNSSEFRGYKTNILSASIKDDVDAGIKAIVAEVLRAKKFGFTASEFERAKKETLEQYEELAAEKDKTDSRNFAEEYINNFLDKEAAPGIEAEKNAIEVYFKNLKVEEINANVAKFNLNQPAFVLFMGSEGFKKMPTDASLLASFEAAKKQTVEAYVEKKVSNELMDEMPVAGKIVGKSDNKDFDSKIYTLSNGIKVITKKTDFKNDEILLRGYQWGGNTNLTEQDIQMLKYSNLLFAQLGLGKHNSSELQKMLAGVNVNASFGNGDNTFNVNGSSSVKDVEKFMQVLHLKLTNINFDKDEMEGLRSAAKQQMGMMKNNPAFKFADTLAKYRYNNSKRMPGFLPDLTEMEQLNFDDVEKLYHKMVSNLNGLTLVFVGNVDDEKMLPLLEKYVASIPTKATASALNTANIQRQITGNNTFIVKGGKENKSEIRLSYYGNIASFDDKENMAYGLLNDVLQMKTTEVLREQLGATYSPRVSGSMTRSPMLEFNLSLSVSAAPENVDKLTAAFDELIKKVAAGEISEDDMLKAKEQRKKTIETQQKTNGYWSSVLEQQDQYGYNSSLITSYFTRLNNATKQELIDVANKYLTKANVLKAILNPDK